MARTTPKVLVVDDDLDIRDALLEVLAGEGYGAVGLTNGLEAMEYLRGAPPPACIVLDIMMPVMNGLQLLSRMAEDPTLSGIPVIVVSAGNQLQVREVRRRAEAVLAKPFDLDVLLGALRRCCC